MTKSLPSVRLRTTSRFTTSALRALRVSWDDFLAALRNREIHGGQNPASVTQVSVVRSGGNNGEALMRLRPVLNN